jgi:hypothetical protein
MSQSLSAEVANVVRAEPSPGRPERYEVHLDLKPEPGFASTRLVLVFQMPAAAMLADYMTAKPPNGLPRPYMVEPGVDLIARHD